MNRFLNIFPLGVLFRVRLSDCAGWHIVAIATVALAGVPKTVAAATFTPLGDLLGGRFFSIASDVSADGSVVVGSASSMEHTEAFRWTRNGGMVGLGVLPGTDFNRSDAYAVSADGAVVVGGSRRIGVSTDPFRWTETSGMLNLGHLTTGQYPLTYASDVSGDGSLVVGVSESLPYNEAFRWTAVEGIEAVRENPGVFPGSQARAVSDDGSVIVGAAESQAFRWTLGGDSMKLGALLPQQISVAQAVSANGDVVVGGSVSSFGFEAFRWADIEGMIALGELIGGVYFSHANAVSANGNVIVGESETELGREAFIWTPLDGMRNLRTVLIANGTAGLDGWTLRAATAISSDGLTIVGYGINPDGNSEAWIAVIPEPATVNLLFPLAGFVILQRRLQKPILGNGAISKHPKHHTIFRGLTLVFGHLVC